MPLRLGYVDDEKYPFIYRHGWRRAILKGIFVDIWDEAAAKVGMLPIEFVRADTYGSYSPDNTTGDFDGLLGMLQRGEVDGTLEEFTCRPARLRSFHYTHAFMTEYVRNPFNYYEQADMEGGWSLTAFIVFPLPLAAYVVAAAAVSYAVEYVGAFARAAAKMREKTRLSSLLHRAWCSSPMSARRPAVALFHLATLILLIIYNSLYSGSAIHNSITPETTTTVFLEGIHDGSSRLVMKGNYSVKPEAIKELFGGSLDDVYGARLVANHDLQTMADKLCAPPIGDSWLKSFGQAGVFAGFFAYQLGESGKFRARCSLRPIKAPSVAEFSSLLPRYPVFFDQTFLIPNPMSFFLRKTRRLVPLREVLNRHLLILYGADRFDALIRRHMSHPQGESVEFKPKSFSLTVMTLSQLRVPFVILLLFYSLASLVLFIERIHYHRRRTVNREYSREVPI